MRVVASRASLARSSEFRVVSSRDSRYYLGMEKLRKVYRGIGLYPEDWSRIDRLREHREDKIEFIETALQHEFERRESVKKESRAA